MNDDTTKKVAVALGAGIVADKFSSGLGWVALIGATVVFISKSATSQQYISSGFRKARSAIAR